VTGPNLAAFHAAYCVLTLDAASKQAIGALLGLGVALLGAGMIAQKQLAAWLVAGHMMG